MTCASSSGKGVLNWPPGMCCRSSSGGSVIVDSSTTSSTTTTSTNGYARSIVQCSYVFGMDGMDAGLEWWWWWWWVSLVGHSSSTLARS